MCYFTLRLNVNFWDGEVVDNLCEAGFNDALLTSDVHGRYIEFDYPGVLYSPTLPDDKIEMMRSIGYDSVLINWGND